LPAAEYRFQVQSKDSRGGWSEPGLMLRIHQRPAWWNTWQFRGVWITSLLLLTWFVYQIRMRQLQKDFKKLRDMIETIPAMAWTALPNGSNEFVNCRWVEYTGLSVEDTAGSGWTVAVHPEDRQPYLKKWRASLAAGEPFEAEVRFRCAANGEYRWLLARSVPLRDKHGKILRWYGILTDIEDRKRAEQEHERVHQLEVELAHINRVGVMGELAASIAHEVNQPLSGVVSNASAGLRWLARDQPELEEVRAALGSIVRDGKRAGDVIARIRALTRRTTTPRVRLDLNELIREVLILIDDEAKRHSVTIQTQFADELPPVVGDRVQLQQVVLNLVMNAIQAMSSIGARAREMAITTRSIEPDQVQVTVEDWGVGIDPEKIHKMFEPFYTTKSGGMGMGLSISRSIIQAHGGRLWAAAKDGQGAAFHFTVAKYLDEDSREAVAGI
jgi:PAS domain S-box-containing protein